MRREDAQRARCAAYTALPHPLESSEKQEVRAKDGGDHLGKSEQVQQVSVAPSAAPSPWPFLPHCTYVIAEEHRAMKHEEGSSPECSRSTPIPHSSQEEELGAFPTQQTIPVSPLEPRSKVVPLLLKNVSQGSHSGLGLRSCHFTVTSLSFPPQFAPSL